MGIYEDLFARIRALNDIDYRYQTGIKQRLKPTSELSLLVEPAGMRGQFITTNFTLSSTITGTRFMDGVTLVAIGPTTERVQLDENGQGSLDLDYLQLYRFEFEFGEPKEVTHLEILNTHLAEVPINTHNVGEFTIMDGTVLLAKLTIERPSTKYVVTIAVETVHGSITFTRRRYPNRESRIINPSTPARYTHVTTDTYQGVITLI